MTACLLFSGLGETPDTARSTQLAQGLFAIWRMDRINELFLGLARPYGTCVRCEAFWSAWWALVEVKAFGS